MATQEGWGEGSTHSHFVHLFSTSNLILYRPLLCGFSLSSSSLMLRIGCIDKTLKGLDYKRGLMCAHLTFFPPK